MIQYCTAQLYRDLSELLASGSLSLQLPIRTVQYSLYDFIFTALTLLTFSQTKQLVLEEIPSQIELAYFNKKSIVRAPIKVVLKFMAYYSECSFLSINMATHINSKLQNVAERRWGLLTCIFFCVWLLEQILYLSLNYVTELNLKYHFATALMFSLTKSKVITTYFQCRKSFPVSNQ